MTMLRDSTFTQTANKSLTSGAPPKISEMSGIYGNQPAGVPAAKLLLRRNVSPQSTGSAVLPIVSNPRYQGQGTEWLPLFECIETRFKESFTPKTTTRTIIYSGGFADAYSVRAYPLIIASKEEVDKEDLSAALTDLYEVAEEAQEKGLTVPSDVAFENAERLLKAMYAILPWRYEVYPMSYGKIAIDAPNGQGASVIALCESNGGAMCLANLISGYRGNRYRSAAELPNAFLREALLELRRDTIE